MKTKLLIAILFISFSWMTAQEKEGIKMQSADEKEFIQVDKAPALISQLKPDYPREAKLQDIQGKVFLKLLIDEKGNVAKAKVEKGVNSLLDKSALNAAKKAKFSPAMSKDKPVKVWVVLPIAFKLDVGIDIKKDQSIEKGKPESGEYPGPNEFVQVEKLPEFKSGEKPSYPEEAKKNGIEGKVFMKVLVDKEGLPKKAIVIKSDNAIFNQSATEAAMKSKFSPALQNGKPIAVWIVLPYKFALEMKELNSNLYSTEAEASSEFKRMIDFIKEHGESESINNEKEKTKPVDIDIKYGDESAIFEVEGKSYKKFLMIIRKGNGIVKITQDSIDDLKNYLAKDMNKVFKKLEKKK